MRVSGVDNVQECGALFAGQPSIDPLIASTSDASLITVVPPGSIERRALRVTSSRANDPSHFWIAASSARDDPASGMSGGLVTLRDKVVGFLLAGDRANNAYENNWRVLRIDKVATSIGALFEGRTNAIVDDKACLTAPAYSPGRGATPLSAPKPTDPGGNLASMSCGASIIGFSPAGESNAHRPENLIDPNATVPWRTAPAYTVSVEVRLCGERAHPVRTVKVESFEECSSKNTSISSAEVLVRGNPRGPWTSLGAVDPNGADIEVSSSSPLSTYDIRIVLVGSAPEQPVSACYGQLSVR
jgi:hypothetical protein